MRIAVRKKYNIPQIIQLVLLFLMSLNFANLYFYIIFLTFFICVSANIKRFRVDVVAILLTLISVCYILFYPPVRDSYTTVLKQFSYPMCYLIGLNLFWVNNYKQKNNCDSDEQIKTSILVVAYGTLTHYLLNAAINIGSLFRNTQDFWTGEVVSATHQALMAVIAMGVFCVGLFGEKPLWKKLLYILGMFAIFAYNFVLAGRTIIILGALTLCVAFLYIQHHSNFKKRINKYLFLCVIIVGVLVLFLNNVGGIRDWALNSNLSSRFNTQDVLADRRLESKMVYISHIIDYPFGGGRLKDVVGGDAHELYLDVFNDIGIIGYLLIIAVVLMCMINVAKAFVREKLSVETKSLILCVFMGINVVFFLEPILQGMPWFFCIFCFLSGAVKNILKKNK